MIAFLLGPDSDFITGAVIAVAGDMDVLAKHRGPKRGCGVPGVAAGEPRSAHGSSSPTRNRPGPLAELFESLARQTYLPLKIVVLNGGERPRGRAGRSLSRTRRDARRLGAGVEPRRRPQLRRLPSRRTDTSCCAMTTICSCPATSSG